MVRLPSADRPLHRIYYNRRKRVLLKSGAWALTVGTPAEVRTMLDGLIAWCRGLATDLAIGINNAHDGNNTLIARSSMCKLIDMQINGLTPHEYIVQQAHKVGVRVFPWWSIYDFGKWGPSGGFLINPMPDDADHHDTSNGANIVNYHNPATRQEVVDIIVDYYKYNPGTDGIMVDGIRTDGLSTQSTAEDVTALLGALRSALRGKVLIVDTPGFVGILESYKADFQTWVQNGWIDVLCGQQYYNTYISKRSFYDFSGQNMKKCVYSSGYDSGTYHITEEELKGVILKISAENRDWSIFRYDVGMDDFRTHVMNALQGSLTTITQLPVTKVRVTPATDFSITVNGTAYTQTYADISDHTTDVAVKGHMSTLIGSDQPYIHFNRYPDATSLIINIGDFPRY